METQRIKRILKGYLSGNSNPETREQVENWYQSFETDEPKALSQEKETDIREEIWNRIEPEINERSGQTRRILPLWLKIAALFILIPGICWIFFKRTDAPHTQCCYTEITAKTGEQKNVQMSDGTLLVLNSGSSIRIQKDFSKERKVEIIDGEVFFDVKKDIARPFIITSGKITTKVLGTAFNISAYKELSTMSVGVTGGRVSVSAGDRILDILDGGRQLTYSKSDGSFHVGTIDRGLLSWRAGNLVLNDASFGDMATLMKKNFGIRIISEDETIRKTTKYTTMLPTSLKPVEAAEVLAAIHNLKIRKEQDTIYFYKTPGRN